MSQVKTLTVFNARTTTGTSEIFQPWGTRRTIEVTVSGTGAVSTTVVVQISNDETNWITLTTLAVSGTTTATDGAAMDAAWRYMRLNMTALSGTGAAVTAIVGSHNG